MNNNAIDLRERLGITATQFARLVGVDTRTVMRWESYDAMPCGTAAAIIRGLQMSLRRRPAHAEKILEFVRETAAIGGLRYMLIELFDRALTQRRAYSPRP